MRRQASRPQGFTLIEAAVAVGIIAILASAAAPLVMKALNQQRERTTRDGLKIAFEAMFGSRERRVANMRADFGFTPPAADAAGVVLSDLRFLTRRTSQPAGQPAPRTYAPFVGAAFNIGWNGPYWNGSVRSQGVQQIPVDGWGKAIRLRYVNGYRVESPGQDGSFGTADDLFYPSVVALLSNYSCTPKITISNMNKTTDYTLTVRFVSSIVPGGVACVESGTNTSTGTTVPKNSAKTFILPNSQSSLPPGPVEIVISITAPTTSTSRILYDFQAGEQRTIEYGIN